MKNFNLIISPVQRSKTPFKLYPNLKSSDETILNIRKHTTPVPFSLRSSQRECRELLIQKLHSKKADNSLKSSSRLVSFTPNKLTPKNIFYQIASEDRPSTCSPDKVINLIERKMEDRSRAKVHVEWKKILACVKKPGNILISNHTETKKKPKYTIDKILRSDKT